MIYHKDNALLFLPPATIVGSGVCASGSGGGVHNPLDTDTYPWTPFRLNGQQAGGTHPTRMLSFEIYYVIC